VRIDIHVNERAQLKSPIVVCGLPGAAFVGKFALDHLIGELGAKPLAEFYSGGFPPQITVGEDGVGRPVRNVLFYWRNTAGGENDLILYTGDSQPTEAESEYELSDSVIDFLIKEHNVRRLITLGAYVTGSTTVSPKVYAAATDQNAAQVVEANGCKLMTDGAITGMNGLLLGIARLKGLSGYALLGETSGLSFDAKASEAILNVLSNLIGLKLDYAKLEQRASEAQEAVRAIEAIRRGQNPEPGSGRGSTTGKRLDYIS